MKQKSDFRRLHEQESCFLIPNLWDAGTARILASLGVFCVGDNKRGDGVCLGSVRWAGVTKSHIGALP